MPRNRTIHAGALDVNLQLIEMNKKALKLINEMAGAYRARIASLEELARANYTGDKDAFAKLAPAVNTGSTRMFYTDPHTTRRVVQHLLTEKKERDHEISGTEPEGQG